MNISYHQPLSDAWLRTKSLLFQPFDLGFWFALGFTAFLAHLSDGFSGGGGGNFSSRFNHKFDWDSCDGWFDGSCGNVTDLLGASLGIGLIITVLLATLFIGLLVMWLGSRGSFMFLDNLVQRRSEVTRPWGEFSAQGNSLFMWQLGYTLVSMLILGFFTVVGVLGFIPLFSGDASWVITVPLVIITGTIAFILIMIMVFVEFFLISYVVPIMYKERLSTMNAWSLFLPLFRENPAPFVLSGLFYLLLSVAGAFILLAGGLLTCCVGLLLLALPYIGSVVTLPMSVTLRYFTLDFLGQFGSEFRLLQPVSNLGQVQGNGTMIGPEDLSQDGSADESGPQPGGD